MGLGKIRTIGILGSVVMIIFLVLIVNSLDDSDDHPHLGTFNLTGIIFYPNDLFTLMENHSPLNSSLRNELNQTDIRLTIEIENTPIVWTYNYSYFYRNGIDLFEVDLDNRTLMLFTEWRYDTEYRYNIRFLCNTSNETVKSLPLFDHERYTGGSFQITGGRTDRIKYFDEDIPFYEKTGRRYVLYYGDVEDYHRLNNDLCIEIDEIGNTDSA